MGKQILFFHFFKNFIFSYFILWVLTVDRTRVRIASTRDDRFWFHCLRKEEAKSTVYIGRSSRILVLGMFQRGRQAGRQHTSRIEGSDENGANAIHSQRTLGWFKRLVLERRYGVRVHRLRFWDGIISLVVGLKQSMILNEQRSRKRCRVLCAAQPLFLRCTSI